MVGGLIDGGRVCEVWWVGCGEGLDWGGWGLVWVEVRVDGVVGVEMFERVLEVGEGVEEKGVRGWEREGEGGEEVDKGVEEGGEVGGDVGGVEEGEVVWW